MLLPFGAEIACGLLLSVLTDFLVVGLTDGWLPTWFTNLLVYRFLRRLMDSLVYWS